MKTILAIAQEQQAIARFHSIMWTIFTVVSLIAAIWWPGALVATAFTVMMLVLNFRLYWQYRKALS